MKPEGVTMDWLGRVCLCFDDGHVLLGETDKIIYKDYWYDEKGNLRDWPVDPITKKKMSIWEGKKKTKHPGRLKIMILRFIARCKKRKERVL